MKRQLKAITLITMLGIAGAVAQTTDASTTDAPATTTGGTSGSSITEGHSGGRFGAGLMLGEPTGATLKYWFNERMAIDGGIGWSFESDTDLHIHSDFLWHKFDVFSVSKGQLPLYFGVGARVKFRDDDSERFGIRAPIGVSYIFEDKPVDVFVEVAPVLDVAPSTRLGFMASIGARYWF